MFEKENRAIKFMLGKNTEAKVSLFGKEKPKKIAVKILIIMQSEKYEKQRFEFDIPEGGKWSIDTITDHLTLFDSDGDVVTKFAPQAGFSVRHEIVYKKPE